MSSSTSRMASVARAVAVLALGAALAAAGGPSASAQVRHGAYFGHGRGFYGPRFRGYGYAGFWPGYFGWGWPYAYPAVYAYPYPYYVYPPTYVAAPAPPPPAPPVAAAPVERHFTVYFDFDKFDLTREGTQVVDRAVGEAKRGGPANIEVVGNTDLAGTGRYNQILSERRAATVRDYMVAHGVPREEIQIHALGKTDPAVQTANGVREPRNRRVEIVITPQGAAPQTSMSAPPPMPSVTGIPSRDEAMQAAAPVAAPRGPVTVTPISAPASQSVGQPIKLVTPQQ